MEESRRFRRLEKTLISIYEIIDRGVDRTNLYDVGPIDFENISMGGAKFVTSQQLPVGCKLKIAITAFPKPELIQIVGRAIWSKKIGEESFAGGIHFEEFIDKSRDILADYVSWLDVSEFSLQTPLALHG